MRMLMARWFVAMPVRVRLADEPVMLMLMMFDMGAHGADHLSSGFEDFAVASSLRDRPSFRIDRDVLDLGAKSN
jgi:hypothetical protein